jgi:replicative DNA helicase
MIIPSSREYWDAQEEEGLGIHWQFHMLDEMLQAKHENRYFPTASMPTMGMSNGGQP